MESILPERNGLIYERSLEVSGIEPLTNTASLMRGLVSGPGFSHATDNIVTGAGGVRGIPNTVLFNGEGQDGFRIVSAAGGIGFIFQAGSMPLYRQANLFPTSYRTRRIYVFESVLMVDTGPGVSRATMGVHAQLANDLQGANATGIEWSAGIGENGGRWTVRRRRTPADPVSNVADSGVAAGATPHRLAMVFREASIQVDFYLDDVLVTTITDPVSIVGFPGQNLQGDTALVFATGAGAVGTNFCILAARYRIFDPDFPLYPSDFNSRYPG